MFFPAVVMVGGLIEISLVAIYPTSGSQSKMPFSVKGLIAIGIAILSVPAASAIKRKDLKWWKAYTIEVATNVLSGLYVVFAISVVFD